MGLEVDGVTMIMLVVALEVAKTEVCDVDKLSFERFCGSSNPSLVIKDPSQSIVWTFGHSRWLGR